MDDGMTFCEECREYVTYCSETTFLASSLKGEKCSYIGKKAVCSKCGAEVYVAEIEDSNLKALYDSYYRNHA